MTSISRSIGWKRFIVLPAQDRETADYTDSGRRISRQDIARRSRNQTPASPTSPASERNETSDLTKKQAVVSEKNLPKNERFSGIALQRRECSSEKRRLNTFIGRHGRDIR